MVQAVEPAEEAAEPTEQSEQVDARSDAPNLPTGHASQTALPSVEKVPAVQLRHVDAPTAAVAVPEAQFVQVDAPGAAANFPRVQAGHEA